MGPDFNRLRLFFHVYEARSVGRGAAALHVTQSAASQALAKLEAELGAQLFVRKHRAVVPTPAGDALFGVVGPFVAALRTGLAEIQRARHERGALAIAGHAAEQVGREPLLLVGAVHGALQRRQVDARLARAAHQLERDAEAAEQRAEPRLPALRVAVRGGPGVRRVAIILFNRKKSCRGINWCYRTKHQSA